MAAIDPDDHGPNSINDGALAEFRFPPPSPKSSFSEPITALPSLSNTESISSKEDGRSRLWTPFRRSREKYSDSHTIRYPLSRSTGRTNSSLNAKSAIVEKKLLRKLDFLVLPVLIGMCLFQTMDRAAIGIAQINGIQKHLNISQTQYNFAVSICQIGYLLFQIPSNLLITKIHPGAYLSVMCLLWSVAGIGHSFVKNYTQLLGVRFLLGACDAPLFVGSLHLMSSWYTRKELSIRMAASLASIIFSMILLYPLTGAIIEGLEGVHSMEGWRWVFLIFSLIGAALSVVGALILPGYPNTPTENATDEGRSRKRKWWLSEEEETLAKVKIDEDRIAVKNVERRKIWIGLWDALRDTRTWVFVIMMMSRKSFDGLWTYKLPILKSLHLVRVGKHGLSEETIALLLATGPAIFAGISVCICAYSSDRRSERTWHIVIPLLTTIAGLSITAATQNGVARYVAMFVWQAGLLAGVTLTWSWVAGTIQETPEKKAAAIAIVNVLGGLGAIWGPFLFRAKDAPGYRMAFGILIGLALLDVACVVCMKWLLQRANRALRERTESDGYGGGEKQYVL